MGKSLVIVPLKNKMGAGGFGSVAPFSLFVTLYFISSLDVPFLNQLQIYETEIHNYFYHKLNDVLPQYAGIQYCSDEQ